MQIKKLAPGGKLPFGTLIGGSDAVHEEWRKFHTARYSDQKNEGFPRDSRKLSDRTKKDLGI